MRLKNEKNNTSTTTCICQLAQHQHRASQRNFGKKHRPKINIKSGNIMYYKENKKDELWVGNVNVCNTLAHLKRVKYRLGCQAFDIKGKKISPSYMLPLFIAKVDFKKYDTIMVERSKE